MIAESIINKIANSQLVIVDKREAGKTTLLKEIIKYNVDNNRLFVLVDTAVDHEKKSILVYARKQYPSNINVKIVEDNKLLISVIKNMIAESEADKKPMFFDLSFFLEKSYDYTGIKRKMVRSIYRKHFRLLLSILINEKKDVPIIIDEVEFDLYTLSLLRKFTNFVLTTHSILFKEWIKMFFPYIFSVNEILPWQSGIN
jgi:hypothetical protein